MSEVITNESDERLTASAIKARIILSSGDLRDKVSLLGRRMDVLRDSEKIEDKEEYLKLSMEHSGMLPQIGICNDIIEMPEEKLTNLIELLRKLRGRLAHQKQVAPYVIFPDDVFVHLILRRPKTLEELAMVKGFPQEGARIQKWGPAVVAIFGNKEVSDFEVSTDAEGEVIPAPVMKRMQTF